MRLLVRNEQNLEDLLADSDLASASQAVAATSGDFEQLVKLLHLDKSRDFIFGNLREVDFSNADLRGFDFTGADLRGSFGSSVQIDHTTVFEGADLQGSCFATYMRERELFSGRPEAGAMYQMLRGADPYEVSSWLHGRFTEGSDRHPLLKKLDDDTAAILCQKLLTDEIDLTKRADLFHHLRNITGSPQSLRELLLNVFAHHQNDTQVMQKFIKIAGGMYGGDWYVGQTLINLTKSRSEQVREAAFTTLGKTDFFRDNFAHLRSSFMSDDNKGIRQRLLLATAVTLGRSSVSSINLNAWLSDVSFDRVLDFADLLNDSIAVQIATKARQRELSNEQRYVRDPRAELLGDGAIPNQAGDWVISRQEEVLVSTPILRLLFAADHPARAKGALARLRSKAADHRRSTERRIARSFARKL